MNDTIKYRPYRSEAWFVPFGILLVIFFLVFSGGCLFQSLVIHSAVSFLLGILCIWLTKVLYDTSRIVLLFEHEGLRIIGDKHTDHRYIPWSELTHVYYAKTWKGFMFAVLAAEGLDQKATRRYANHAANTGRISVDNVIVFPLDHLQDMSSIKETIASKMQYIDT